MWEKENKEEKKERKNEGKWKNKVKVHKLFSFVTSNSFYLF